MMAQQHHPRMDARLARRLAQKKQRLDAYRPLPSFTVRRLHDDVRVVLTYHSNALEGKTLTLAETQLVLEYGMTVDGHLLREFLEATNHAEAFDALSALATGPITSQTVLALHRLVMEKIDEHAGELRTVQVSMRGADFTPPPARDVPGFLCHIVHRAGALCVLAGSDGSPNTGQGRRSPCAIPPDSARSLGSRNCRATENCAPATPLFSS